MTSDPRTRTLSQTCAERGPNRPLHTKGGSPNYLEKSLDAAARAFQGDHHQRNVIPGLFGIQKTGVSTQTIREAAEAFLGSLSAEQHAKTLFPVDTEQWRKWSNIHPTLMRHGTPLFEMNDHQRDCAFALMRESLSQNGFEEALNVMHLNETVLEMTGTPCRIRRRPLLAEYHGQAIINRAVGVAVGRSSPDHQLFRPR